MPIARRPATVEDPDNALTSTAYRLAVAESMRFVLKYFDVPQVFITNEGINSIRDLTLKQCSSSFKTCGSFFDIIRHVQCKMSMEEIADVLALDETEDPIPAGCPPQMKPRGRLDDEMKHQVVVSREEADDGTVVILHHYEVRGRGRFTMDRMNMLSWGTTQIWNYVTYGNTVKERVVLQLILARIQGAKKLCAEVTMTEIKDNKLPMNVDWEDGINYIEPNAPRYVLFFKNPKENALALCDLQVTNGQLTALMDIKGAV